METFFIIVFAVLLITILIWAIVIASMHDENSFIMPSIWAIIAVLGIAVVEIVNANTTEPIVHKSSVEVCPVLTETTVIINGDTVKSMEYTYSFPRE